MSAVIYNATPIDAMNCPSINAIIRSGIVICICATSFTRKQIKSAIYPTNTILMIVPNPMQCRTVKNTIISNTIFITSCQLPNDHPINPLIARFIPLNGSTPKPAIRRKDTHRPINKIPVTINRILVLDSI